MAGISIQLARAKKELDGQQYILTKIDYTKDEAEEDGAYYKERGNVTKIIEEDGYWLIYTKIGK